MILDFCSTAAPASPPTDTELLREKGTPYAELDLADTHWTDDELVDHMLAHPILINRPIVLTPWGGEAVPPV